MFSVGDLIKHKREELYYLVADKKIYISGYSERIVFIVLDIYTGEEIKLHYPLMTCYYEKIS